MNFVESENSLEKIRLKSNSFIKNILDIYSISQYLCTIKAIAVFYSFLKSCHQGGNSPLIKQKTEALVDQSQSMSQRGSNHVLSRADIVKSFHFVDVCSTTVFWHFLKMFLISDEMDQAWNVVPSDFDTFFAMNFRSCNSSLCKTKWVQGWVHERSVLDAAHKSLFKSLFPSIKNSIIWIFVETVYPLMWMNKMTH